MNKEKPYVMCECGMPVYGISIKQATAMLENHRRSKAHKKLMTTITKNEIKPGRKKGQGKGRANYSHKPIKTPEKEK